MDRKRLYAFYKAYERYPFLENAKELNKNKIFIVSDKKFDYFYFTDEFLVKNESEILEKLSQEHIEEYKKFKEEIFKDYKEIGQKEIIPSNFLAFFQIENEKFKPIIGYASYHLKDHPDINCAFIDKDYN